jgi:hypothetical protein
MTHADVDAIERMLSDLDFAAPPLAEVWRRPARSRRPLRVLFAGLGVAAALLLTGIVLAASSGWFARLVPVDACAQGSPTCGADYHAQSTVIDHVSGMVGVNVIVRPGVEADKARITAIAAEVAKTHAGASRVIVYVFSDFPPGDTLVAGFAMLPGPSGDPEPPLPALRPYLLLTYDVRGSGAVAIWP